MHLKQSFCYPMYTSDSRSPAELLAGAKKIGYDAVEFWGRNQYGDHRELFDAAVEAGLTIASMAGHDSLGDGLNRAENHERILGEIADSLEVATRYGIPGVICFSGNRNPGQSDLEGLRVCADGLRKAAPLAETAGVSLNIELLNSKIDHPGYQCDSSDWGYALCDAVNSPRVKVLFDIYHMQIMEGDIIRSLTAGARFLGHIHTAGNPGRGPLGDDQESNYRGICGALRTIGYQGYVGHEFKPVGDPLIALEEAFRICADAP